MERFFNRTKILVNDILVNVWNIVDQMFNAYNLQAKRGEPCSVSSAARRNQDRNVEKLSRKKIGHRNYLIITNANGHELGCGEGGLEEEAFDTKVLVESGLKTPKIMYDMFVQILKKIDNNEEAAKKICVVGLVFSRYKLILLAMDCPKGYVCRLRATNSVQFAEKAETLGAEFRQVYELLYKAMDICRQTEHVVDSYLRSMEVDFGVDGEDEKLHLP